MIQAIEAEIDENGHIHLSQPVTVRGLHRVLITILDEPPPRITEQGKTDSVEAEELFGIWKDHSDTAPVADSLRELRKGRV